MKSYTYIFHGITGLKTELPHCKRMNFDDYPNGVWENYIKADGTIVKINMRLITVIEEIEEIEEPCNQPS